MNEILQRRWEDVDEYNEVLIRGPRYIRDRLLQYGPENQAVEYPLQAYPAVLRGIQALLQGTQAVADFINAVLPGYFGCLLILVSVY